MLTYAGYNDLVVKEDNVQGKDGEFKLRKFRFGDNSGRKKGCRDFTLVYPADPILPTTIYPGNTYKELTVGKTRPQTTTTWLWRLTESACSTIRLKSKRQHAFQN